MEGYVECIATGLIAGVNACLLAAGEPLRVPPRSTAIGSLINYLVSADPQHFQPENINFGIMPPPELPLPARKMGKMEKHLLQTKRALADMDDFAQSLNDTFSIT